MNFGSEIGFAINKIGAVRSIWSDGSIPNLLAETMNCCAVVLHHLGAWKQAESGEISEISETLAMLATLIISAVTI
jgi:hypothetical protein